MKDDAPPADDEALVVPAPARPRRLDCLVMLLAVPLLNGMHVIAMLMVFAAEQVLVAVGLPRSFGILMGVGTWVLSLGALGLLLHAHQTRYRAATVERDRAVVGLIDPPRGVILPFDWLVGFRCTGAGVVLVVRGKPWTRWLGPLIACEGRLMHQVIERLEAHGVRRIDG